MLRQLGSPLESPDCEFLYCTYEALADTICAAAENLRHPSYYCSISTHVKAAAERRPSWNLIRSLKRCVRFRTEDHLQNSRVSLPLTLDYPGFNSACGDQGASCVDCDKLTHGTPLGYLKSAASGN